MKIVTNGLSRIVFLYKDKAIKVTWINFPKLIKVFKNRKRNVDKNIFIDIFKIIWRILLANRREYLYFKKHSNEKFLLPINKVFLFGFITVQPKAEVCHLLDLKWQQLLQKFRKEKIHDSDLLTPENFCTHNGILKLLDYGSKRTQEELSIHGFEIFKL